MKKNANYVNPNTGTTFKVGGTKTEIKPVGKPPVYVNSSSIGKHKHR